MLKTKLTSEEKYGLSFDEWKEAERYLKQHKTAGVLNKTVATPLYELFLLGYPFIDIQAKYPQFPMGQIILTAAFNGWIKDREKLAASIGDRIKARIFRSTVEQVEFLTDMVSVSTAEGAEEVRRYLSDPKKNPIPSMRIKNLKEYQQVIDMLASVAESIRNMSKPPEPQEALPIRSKALKLAVKDKSEEQILLAELAGEDK